MNRKHVLVLVALGALAAFLLYKGPDAVVEFVMRALGKGEQARRALLVPNAQLALDGLRLELEEQHNIRTFVGSTLRTPSEQKVLVAGGASTTQNSWHLLGRAVDLYPIDPASNQPDLNGRLTDFYLTMHRVADKWGWRGLAFDLQTGKKKYLPNGKWDGGHLEYPEGMTFAQASAVGRAIG